jgi:hypothetical protein
MTPLINHILIVYEREGNEIIIEIGPVREFVLT